MIKFPYNVLFFNNNQINIDINCGTESDRQTALKKRDKHSLEAASQTDIFEHPPPSKIYGLKCATFICIMYFQ